MFFGVPTTGILRRTSCDGRRTWTISSTPDRHHDDGDTDGIFALQPDEDLLLATELTTSARPPMTRAERFFTRCVAGPVFVAAAFVGATRAVVTVSPSYK